MSSINIMILLVCVISSWYTTIPSVSAAADETIPIMLDGDVVLTCPPQRSPAPQVKWIGPDNKVIATRGVLSQSLDLSRYRIIPDSVSGVSSTLIINEVRLEDEGIYQCLEADSLIELYSINVTVLVSVQSITFLELPSRINEGSKVQIKCLTDGSKPAPEIQWVKRNHDLKITRLSGVNEDVVHPNGTVRRTNTLTLTVDRSDYLAFYTCTATVSVFTRQAVWTPDVYLFPMEPWLQSDQSRYSEGSTARFQCVTSGSRPKAHISWLINNQPISDTLDAVTNEDRQDEDGTFSSSSRLALEVSRDMNGADVVCSVTNTVMTSEGQGVRNSSIRLVVEYAPIVSIKSLTAEIKEGEEAKFTCTTDAEPPVMPGNVYLGLNGEFLPETRFRRTGEQFVVANVSRFDRGRYQCVAKNSQGASSSLPTVLTVHFAPACTHSNIRYAYATIGNSITIPCPMQAFPHDATVTWVRRSSNQTLHTETAVKWSTEDVAESVFRFTVRAYEDITCYASNSMGDSAVPCTVRLRAPEPPSAPQTCLLLRLPNASRELRCAAGRDGGSPQTFTLKVQGHESGEEAMITGAERPCFLLDHLHPDADFNLTVCAVSQSFPYSPVCADSVILHPDRDSQSMLTSSASTGEESTVFIILGVVLGCCAIAAVVIFIVVCRRHRQKSRAISKPGKTYDAEFRHHRTTSTGPDLEYVTATDPLQASSPHGTSVLETKEMDRALMDVTPSSPPSAATGQQEKEDRRLSQGSSKSTPLVESVRFQSSTKVYVKPKEKEEESGSHSRDSIMNDQRKLLGDENNRSGLDGDNSTLSGKENYDNSRSSQLYESKKESEISLKGEADHKLQSQTRDGQQSVSTPRAESIPYSKNHDSDLTDEASFTDMIRKTLQRNRSSLLLPEKRKPKPRPTDSIRPLVSLLGTADPSSSFGPQSSLSASQTELSDDKLMEFSPIYDVPRSYSDWQRAMSLLSLSAAGSSVVSRSKWNKEDYIDMNRRAGSVPALDKLGLSSNKQAGDGKESNYFLVPSNKHAYINLIYSQDHQHSPDEPKNHNQADGSSRERYGSSQQPLSITHRQKTRSKGGQQRRWSSSEQKTHELFSSPAKTATLTPTVKPGHSGSAHPSRRQVQSSVRLSPAPQLKLRPEQQSGEQYRHQSRTGDFPYRPPKSPVATQYSSSPEDSPTYVKMERNPGTPDSSFVFNIGIRDDLDIRCSEKDKEIDRGGATGGSTSPETRRPRLPSVQRNPSYSQAVGTREATEVVQEKAAHSCLFPEYMHDYIIIPTPSPSWSSESSSAKESAC